MHTCYLKVKAAYKVVLPIQILSSNINANNYEFLCDYNIIYLYLFEHSDEYMILYHCNKSKRVPYT